MIPINSLISSLIAACTRHPMRKKIIIAPSLSAGHALRSTLAEHGVSWVNLHVTTPLRLALNTTELVMLGKGLHHAGRGEQRAIIEEGLQHLDSSGGLTYFAPLLNTADLAALLLSPLLELRQAGVSSASLSPHQFVDPQKGREVIALLAHLEHSLASSALLDDAALLQLASANISAAPDALFLLPDNLTPTSAETAFLSALATSRKIQPLLTDKPRGIAAPSSAPILPSLGTTMDTPSQQASHLGSLYDIPGAPPSDQFLHLFRAYGAYSETHEVLRRIKRDALPLDSVTVVCTTPGEYTTQFLSLGASLGLPMTFADGYAVAYTTPGKLLQGLLNWVGDNYLDTRFVQILQGGFLKLGSSPGAISLLRQEKAGWGRDRYRRLIADRRAKQASEGLPQWEQDFHACLTSLVEALPGNDGNHIHLADMCKGLVRILTDHARIAGEADAGALAALVSALNGLALSRANLPVKTALDRVSSQVLSINTGASGPKAGHLHITGYTAAMWQDRRHTYLVGLDMGSFPGSGIQDPILLDDERRRISPALPLRSHNPQRNIFAMAELLTSRSGPVTLSYSSFDTLQARASAPCGLFLQAFRLQQNAPQADYTDLEQHLDPPVSYAPPHADDALCQEEWWLCQALRDQVDAGRASVLDCFPVLNRGDFALEQRASAQFTQYDGRVGAASPGDLLVSATGLEMLARCPYAYYAQYILGLRAPEETQEDLGVWLDAAQRGSLLHDIYCTYMRRVYTGSGVHDFSLLTGIADELITALRHQVPPPNDMAYKYQRLEIMNSLNVFWRVERELPRGAQPAYFEYPFGLGDEKVAAAGYGSAEPVPLDIGNGRRILLRGSIDRVDRLEEHVYAVWDFKTGSNYGYEEPLTYNAGRRLQYGLYAWALEAHLRSSGLDRQARVVRAGYLFPTEKGEGLRVETSVLDRPKLLAILNLLYGILSSGAFAVTQDKNACRFCDFAAVCARDTAQHQVAAKYEDAANSQLALWKELQSYV